MQVHDTCKAAAITAVRFGTSTLPPVAPAKPASAEEEDAANVDTDERTDEPAGQSIVHLTLTGGEKRSILCADLLLSPLVDVREAGNYQPYAQKKASAQPAKASTDDEPVIQIGDYLVEDFDILTDKFVQKIYDAPTFAQYFKASLN